MTMTTPPRRGSVKGKRRPVNGELLVDLAGASAMVGLKEKAIRARCERRLIPFRKLGGRLVFVRRELEDFVAALDGCPLEEALANLRQRGGDSV